MEGEKREIEPEEMMTFETFETTDPFLDFSRVIWYNVVVPAWG
jgi:hypothetical protein